MYICEECGHIFEDPERYEDHHPYGDTYAVERWSLCPKCGQTGYEEAYECTYCGKWTSYLDDGLCYECYEELHQEEEE